MFTNKINWKIRIRERILFWHLIIALPLLLFACQSDSSVDSSLEGRIIFWHSWPDDQATLLEETISDFVELHPGVTISVMQFSQDELLSEYSHAVAEGLGADLFIGSSEWTGDLASSKLIRPIDERELPDSSFPMTVRNTVTYDNQLYGLPLFLYPNALYLNRNLVEQRPIDLDSLLNQADADLQIAFVPRFQEAHWGIQTFGDGLFDEHGNFTLEGSGFTEWLAWLEQAQQEPGVILNIDRAGLIDLFVEGELAYFIAGPEILSQLKVLMGSDNLDVTILPAGSNGPAGPLLPAEVLFYNPASSERQQAISAALGRYLFSPQQSIRLMRETEKVPANPAVSVDARIYPEISGFATQARSAVALPNELFLEDFYRLGDQAYSSVLSGVATPDQAACRFGQRVVEIQRYQSDEVRLPEECEISLPGEES